MRAFACGTPSDACSGSRMESTSGTRNMLHKAHLDRTEAFKCYGRHLKTNKEMTQVGNREFRYPEGGILILPKKSKFGGELRGGKHGKDNKGRRVTPKGKVLIR